MTFLKRQSNSTKLLDPSTTRLHHGVSKSRSDGYGVSAGFYQMMVCADLVGQLDRSYLRGTTKQQNSPQQFHIECILSLLLLETKSRGYGYWALSFGIQSVLTGTSMAAEIWLARARKAKSRKHVIETRRGTLIWQPEKSNAWTRHFSYLSLPGPVNSPRMLRATPQPPSHVSAVNSKLAQDLRAPFGLCLISHPTGQASCREKEKSWATGISNLPFCPCRAVRSKLLASEYLGVDEYLLPIGKMNNLQLTSVT